jgi:hypothetical protein
MTIAPMSVGQIALREQSCSNCRFARRSTVFDRDDALSCRYLPPQPYPTNDWRLVPENFWCGCWERGPIEPLTTASQRAASSGATGFYPAEAGSASAPEPADLHI